MTVLAADHWATNAELIADVAKLGYIKITDRVLDPTYGRGVWWKKFSPTDLTTHNRDVDGVDFRRLPHPDHSFDVVAYDPPYVSVGGRRTSTLGVNQLATGSLRDAPSSGSDFHARYGLVDAPDNPKDLQALMNDGLTEALRVVRPKGIVLMKCQDYISSGKLWLGVHKSLAHALSLGFECVDLLERIGQPRPQPAARQIHARRNLSTLLILRAPRSTGRSVASLPGIII